MFDVDYFPPNTPPWRLGAKQRKIGVDDMWQAPTRGRASGNQSQTPRYKIMMMAVAKAPMMKAAASRIGREKRRAAAFPSCASRWFATFSQAVAINSWARLSSGVLSFVASSRQSPANFRYSATVFMHLDYARWVEPSNARGEPTCVVKLAAVSILARGEPTCVVKLAAVSILARGEHSTSSALQAVLGTESAPRDVRRRLFPPKMPRNERRSLFPSQRTFGCVAV